MSPTADNIPDNQAYLSKITQICDCLQYIYIYHCLRIVSMSIYLKSSKCMASCLH